MHTSTELRATDFQYWACNTNVARTDADHTEADRKIDFTAFCPDYHELDRLAVVSPRLEDGVLHTGYALLAMTTAFYDVQRAKSSDFFIYPQHFAIIAADSRGVETAAGRLNLPWEGSDLGGAWGWLDVWPSSNWIAAPGTPVSLLQAVFAHQINRLFWPEGLQPEQTDDRPRLPDYVYKLLRARLKSVTYYNPVTPTVEVHGTQAAAAIVQESIGRLPGSVLQVLGENGRLPTIAETGEGGDTRSFSAETHPYREAYRQVSVDEFLDEMSACFAEGGSNS